METTKKNISAYVQAAISLLLILCTFLPFFTVKGYDNSSSLSYACSILTFDDTIETKYKVCGYVFVIYFMLIVLNVFIQALASCRALSCLLSMIGFTLLIVAHVNLSDLSIYDRIQYGAGFYLFIALLAALLIIPTIIVMVGNNTGQVSTTDNNKDEADEETKSKIEELKAKIKELEEQEKE